MTLYRCSKCDNTHQFATSTKADVEYCPFCGKRSVERFDIFGDHE